MATGRIYVADGCPSLCFRREVAADEEGAGGLAIALCESTQLNGSHGQMSRAPCLAAIAPVCEEGELTFVQEVNTDSTQVQRQQPGER